MTTIFLQGKRRPAADLTTPRPRPTENGFVAYQRYKERMRQHASLHEPSDADNFADCKHKLRVIRAALAKGSDEWLTCLHEAGHSVAATKLGVRFSIVSVIPDRETLGKIVLYMTESEPRDCMVMAAAGPAAEAHEQRRPDYDLNMTDLRILVQAMTRGGLHLGDRQNRYSALISAKREAKQLVARHWKAINLVARSLLSDRYLTSDGVRALCRGIG